MKHTTTIHKIWNKLMRIIHGNGIIKEASECIDRWLKMSGMEGAGRLSIKDRVRKYEAKI